MLNVTLPINQGSRVHSGGNKIPHKSSYVSNRAHTFSLLAIIVAGLGLTGCVAGSLNSASNITTPTLSLSQPSKDVQTTADTTTPAEGVVDTAYGVTVPAKRPAGKSAKESTNLALADTGATSSPAKQQVASLAATPALFQPPEIEPKSNIRVLEPATPAAAPVVKTTARKGFFASLFDGSKKQETSRPAADLKRGKNAPQRSRKIAVFKPTGAKSLPGVRKLGLFGIYESREGADEGYGNPILIASAGGLARTSPNGLRIQHAGVQVACLRPELVSIIKKVQRRYRRVPIVTSGYRSPARNRRARGARNSMHIYCKAADIQVPGVSKWTLAKYLRSIPGRGGVGTYCHTKSVHIDVGSKRDWNWRCRRGKKRRRRR